MKRLPVLLILAFFALASFSSAYAQDKVGFVDLKKVFDSYGKTKKYDDALEKKGEKYKSALKKKDAELKKMQDSLSLLSDKEKEKKKLEIDTKFLELRQFVTREEGELRQESGVKMQEIIKDIDNLIKNFAKKNGYKYIFDQRMLLYGDESIDLTDQIIGLLKR